MNGKIELGSFLMGRSAKKVEKRLEVGSLLIRKNSFGGQQVVQKGLTGPLAALKGMTKN